MLFCQSTFSQLLTHIKELVIYARYLSASGEVKNSFLSIVELSNGTAEVIEEKLVSFLEVIHHLVGFASDGASVMGGCLTG